MCRAISVHIASSASGVPRNEPNAQARRPIPAEIATTIAAVSTLERAITTAGTNATLESERPPVLPWVRWSRLPGLCVADIAPDAVELCAELRLSVDHGW